MLLTIVLGCFLLMWWKIRSIKKNKQASAPPAYTKLPSSQAYTRTSEHEDDGLSALATGMAAATIIDSITDSLSDNDNNSIFDTDSSSGFDGFGDGDSCGGGSDGDF